MENFNYYTIEPPAELKQYIRSFWVFEGSPGSSSPYIYRSMADPCAEMVFHYKGSFLEVSPDKTLIAGTDSPAILHAPARQFKRYQTPGDFAIFGVYLYPFALSDLFGLSSFELQNALPSIADCLGPDGKSLQDRILFAHNNTERAAILSAYFIQRMQKVKNPEPRLHVLIRHMLHDREPITIEATALRFNISQRQLERKFKTATGYTPKTYARISRFQHALNAYGSDFKNLTAIAYECGYYDQSHFIHDFREFSGYEPGIYFAGKSEGIEYREA
jgi:AraC-like DNA-binding protein